MTLAELLADRQSAVSGKWLDRIIASYPGETARFLKNEHDPFANPVGKTLSTQTKEIVSALAGNEPPEKVAEHLEGIIRIRSIQEFSPSQALSFVFVLRSTIREELDLTKVEELLELEDMIDRLAMVAFDVYTKCREELANIRVNEIKRSVHTLTRRAQRAQLRSDARDPDGSPGPNVPEDRKSERDESPGRKNVPEDRTSDRDENPEGGRGE